ncbi:hypothetical protein ACFC26_23635 [Kitasatospora purpeofusca]|uniref:hypothetical protein n=1 Tax=Kitasatospora purpeofusca TaxID=67352 RepID=UPI0035DE69A9
MATPHHAISPQQRASRGTALHDGPPAVPGAHGDSVRAVAPQARARLTQAQLDGRACVCCQAIAGLKEAGHVVHGGLGYAVKVCRSCPPYAAILMTAPGEEARR